MKNTIIASIAIAFGVLIAGCSSKNVYEPTSLSGAISYDGKLGAEIVDISREGAVLSNGDIINKEDERLSLGLKESQKYLAKTESGYLVADGIGTLFLYQKDGSSKTLYTFSMAVASAMMKNEMLAAVLVDNSSVLVDLRSSEIVFSKQNSPSYANNAKIANPYFFSSLLVFPTLDGKLDIFDLRSNSVIKTLIVSSKKLFSNVIFMDVIGDYLVAASSEKIIAVSPKRLFQKEYEIRDVVFVQDGVYILTKDGKVILCDSELNELKVRKFTFADFVGLIHGDFIYVVEKEGYLIALDKSLVSVNTYELPSSIDSLVFTTRSSIYVDGSYYKLNAVR